jgi:predicted Ser/Thr protein kinase
MGVLVAGTQLAGCLIEETIGRGGMGVVYRARQLELDREVAIKVITTELVDDERTRERFLSEARAAAAVEHANVLPVHGAGVADGQAYLVMRYVHGDDLRTLVRREGPLTPGRAAAIAVALGDALDAIHRAGYVHRDVKPANVLLAETGHVYLSDFGLAKHVLATAGLTESGRWVGTLDFAAPEQIRACKVDARADVYALGGVLHFMLTGAVPYDRDSDEAKLWAHLSDPPPLPSALRPDLPAALDAVVQRAMAKQPDDRQPSAGDLGRAARAAVSGTDAGPERTVASGAAAPGAAPTLPGLLDGSQTLPAGRRVAGARRKRAVVAGGLLALVLAAVSAAIVSTRGDDDGGAQRAGSASAPGAPRSAPPQLPGVGKTLEGIGFRPRDIAVLGGDVWVTSATRRRLARLDASTMRRHARQPLIGRGAVSIAAHGDAVWVAISRAGSVTEIDSRTGLVRRRLPIPVTPMLVAAGADGLWVAGHRTGDAPDVLFRYDRAGRLLGRANVPNDITALAVGGGRAWVAHDGVARLLGFDARVRVRDQQWLLSEARELVYGDRRVWASEPATDSLGRFDPRSGGIAENRVAPRPAGLAVAAGRVFIASYTTQNVVVVDQESLKPVGDPIPVPLNPWGVEAGAGHVWVSGLGANTLSRIDY